MSDQPHVLIVEDDELVQSYEQLQLESNGFRVTTASTGLEMFEALSADQFDLILLDLNLPDGDGLDFAEHIRGAGNIPILVASGRGSTDDKLTALNLGNVDYITKPFDPQELFLRVRNLVQMTSPDDDRPDTHGEINAPLAPLSLRRIRFTPLALGLLVLVIALGAGLGGWYVGMSQDGDELEIRIGEASTLPRASAPASAPNQQASAPAHTVPAAVPAQQPSQMSENPTLPAGECPPIPDVDWWRVQTHDAIRNYVDTKHDGNWENYTRYWNARLKRLEDIYARNSQALAGTLILEGPGLLAYIENVRGRIAAITCLEKTAQK